MGHNIDLQSLLGLPDYVRCPQCKEMTKTNFDEYSLFSIRDPQSIS